MDFNINTPWHKDDLINKWKIPEEITAMRYQSPIEIIQGELETQLENNIMTAVQHYGITVNKEELIKALEYDRHQYEQGFKDGRASASEFKWIPITDRPMTKEEEKEVCKQWGVKELEGWEKRVFTCQLPEDGQEILISTRWGVKMDKCEWDPDCGCGLEENGDWDGIKAWMPLPNKYEEEETE